MVDWVMLSLRCRCRFTFIYSFLNQFFYIFHKRNIKVLGGARRPYLVFWCVALEQAAMRRDAG